jgi:hypothetical protein
MLRRLFHARTASFFIFAIHMKNNITRAAIEIGFIIFLFYTNLLMGEFTGAGNGQSKGMAWALNDIFTASNFAIALIGAFVGYIVFEFLRKKL